MIKKSLYSKIDIILMDINPIILPVWMVNFENFTQSENVIGLHINTT